MQRITLLTGATCPLLHESLVETVNNNLLDSIDFDVFQYEESILKNSNYCPDFILAFTTVSETLAKKFAVYGVYPFVNPCMLSFTLEQDIVGGFLPLPMSIYDDTLEKSFVNLYKLIHSDYVFHIVMREHIDMGLHVERLMERYPILNRRLNISSVKTIAELKNLPSPAHLYWRISDHIDDQILGMHACACGIPVISEETCDEVLLFNFPKIDLITFLDRSIGKSAEIRKKHWVNGVANLQKRLAFTHQWKADSFLQIASIG